MNHPGRDLTQGSIPRHLLAVALPMLLGNLINTGYFIVNTLWLGHIVGEEAIAATAASFPIVFIFVALCAGATMATTILVSQYFGAKQYDLVQKTVGTSFFIAIVLSVVLSVTGVFSASFFLRLLRTPPDILAMATGYLQITYVGFGFMYFSFLITSILRGLGDTKTPVLFMAAGVVINAILDPLLIIGIGPFPRLGLNGAAIASVISSGGAAAMGFFYLRSKGSMAAPRRTILSPDRDLAFSILRIGLPASAQQGLVSVGMAFLTSFVNGFGSAATAAFGVAGRIDSTAFMPAMSIGMAVSALAGQNLGAGKPERVKKIFFWGIIMTVAISGFFALIFVSFPHFLMRLFIDDTQVIDIGSLYLRIVGPSAICFAVMFVSNGIINGAGQTMITLVFTLLSMFGLRIPLALWLSHTPLGVNGIWIAMAVSFFIIMCISLWYYRSGKWQKSMIIKHEPALDIPPSVPTSQSL